MSYEPRLIIKKADMDAKREVLERYYMLAPNSDDKKVMTFLHRIYKETCDSVMIPKIDGIELITCQPELTSFNKLVREQLDELEIQYAEDN